MARIAAGRLLRLRQQHLLVPDENGVQGLKFSREPSQVFRAYCRGLTSDLNKASVQRGPAIERGRAIDHYVAADHGSFDHLAYTQVDDERNHAGEGKIDVIYWLVGVGNHITKCQLYEA